MIEKKVEVLVLTMNVPSGNVTVQERLFILEDGRVISERLQVHMVVRGNRALAQKILPEGLLKTLEVFWAGL